MTLEWSIMIALVALLGNAFFVGAEFGLVSARRSSIELRAANGVKRAKITLLAMEQVSLMLAGAQLGITLCSLVFGAIGEPIVAHLLEPPFAALGLTEAARHIVAFTIAMILMVYLHVVIGEMVPKNIALAGPTRVALWLVPPLFYIVRIIRPVIAGLNAVANGAIRLLGVTPQNEITSSFSRDEVIGFIEESHREGILSAEEEQLLSNSLSFDHQTIAPIVTPLARVIATSEAPTMNELEELVRQTGFSRFPVPRPAGGLKGYIHMKDLLRLEPGKPVLSQLRTLPTVTSSDTARSALLVMQRSGAHIAQVVDGDTVRGVVMLEDVLEELVGTIHDKTQQQIS